MKTKKGTKASMASSKASKSETVKFAAKNTGRLFFLDLAAGRVLTSNPDGSDLKTIVNEGRRLPDGIVVDVAGGHIYWTNMGNPSANDGSIERADLDGKNIANIVPAGATFTPKQLQLDKKGGKLYWSDREGMRVMRCDLDGSHVETLVDTSQGESRPGKDQTKWCVGMAVDVNSGKLYWTQKGNDNAGQGRIFRAGVEIPKGQTPANRKDIEVLYDNLPEPIDLDLDLGNRVIYWTDRGDPPRGNTVNRAPMDAAAGKRKEPEIIFDHLMEGIGLSLDLANNRMFLTDLGGSVYSANLDGSNKKNIVFVGGNLSGIAYTELPATS
jgi:DNA-binding beta-propeller fold protein YncE